MLGMFTADKAAEVPQFSFEYFQVIPAIPTGMIEQFTQSRADFAMSTQNTLIGTDKQCCIIHPTRIVFIKFVYSHDHINIGFSGSLAEGFCSNTGDFNRILDELLPNNIPFRCLFKIYRPERTGWKI